MSSSQFPSLLNSLVPQTSGIGFCQRVGGTIAFGAPRRLINALLPRTACLYAILVPDQTAQPRKFRVIYFGQANNADSRVRPSHERYPDWVKAAGGGSNLFVAFHWMPSSTEQQRCAVEDELISYYNPKCNKTDARSNPSLAAFYGLPRL
jgi:hypothetical protein